jgi:hypothetical protein
LYVVAQKLCKQIMYSVCIDDDEECTAEDYAYSDTAEQLLVRSLQEAASAASAATARSALQLCSFSAICIRSSALLRALPAALLTHLHLTSRAWRSGEDFDHSGISAALVQLRNLRSLDLGGAVGDACLAGVGQLAHLDQIRIRSVVVSSEDAAASSCGLHCICCHSSCMTWALQSEAKLLLRKQHWDMSRP